MNKNTRQTKPLGRSTKEDNAGLSLLHLQLFTVIGDTYKYYNEIVKNISDFLVRLTANKFKNVSLSSGFSDLAIFRVSIHCNSLNPFYPNATITTLHVISSYHFSRFMKMS